MMANIFNLSGFHFRVHGNGKNRFGERFRHGEIPPLVTKIFVGILKMQGERIIDHHRDFFALKVFPQLIPLSITEDECILMKNMV